MIKFFDRRERSVFSLCESDIEKIKTNARKSTVTRWRAINVTFSAETVDVMDN